VFSINCRRTVDNITPCIAKRHIAITNILVQNQTIDNETDKWSPNFFLVIKQDFVVMNNKTQINRLINRGNQSTHIHK